jgi:putative redox protein
MARIILERKAGDFGFEATDETGHVVKLDTNQETGGMNYGVRPMQSLLMALGGCSGIDIVSILKKQKQVIDGFRMTIEGERKQINDFSLWDEVKIIFELKGNIDAQKAKRACDLSMEKYCSVAETLRRAGCSLRWEVKLD